MEAALVQYSTSLHDIAGLISAKPVWAFYKLRVLIFTDVNYFDKYFIYFH